MRRTIALLLLAVGAHRAAAQRGAPAPTYDELRARSCPRSGAAATPAILYGHVLDADTDAPIAGGNLSLVFTDSSGPTPVDRVRRAKTADDGTFVICGLPQRYSGTLQAARGSQATPDVPAASADPSLTTINLALSLTGAKTAVLRGRIAGPAGQPLADAQVSVDGTAASASTGADGTFEITALPAGTQVLVVKKAGFVTTRTGVSLSVREPTQVAAVLGGTQTAAAAPVVGRYDDALRKVGFTERRTAGKGVFLGPNEIDQRHPQRVTDLLIGVPGLSVTDVGPTRLLAGTGAVGSSGSGCVNVFVDRAPFEVKRPGDLDEAYAPTGLAAVELYSGDTEVPRAFYSASRGCPTVVLWTKATLSKP